MPKPRNEIRVERLATPRSLPANGLTLSYEIIDALVNMVRGCVYVETACRLVGVNRGTVQGWLNEGRDIAERIECGQLNPSACTVKQAMCVDLFIEINQAIAESEAEDVLRMEALAKLGDFKAIQFRLERRAPERWGKQRVEERDSTPHDQIEPSIVDYSNYIGDAEEFKQIDPPEDIEDVDIIEESA